MHATEQKIADKITSLGYKKNIIRSMGKNAWAQRAPCGAPDDAAF
jgi:hypothetical protein